MTHELIKEAFRRANRDVIEPDPDGVVAVNHNCDCDENPHTHIEYGAKDGGMFVFIKLPPKGVWIWAWDLRLELAKAEHMQQIGLLLR